MPKETVRGQIEKRKSGHLLIIDRKINKGFFIEPGAYSEVHIKVLAIDRRRVKVGLYSRNPVKIDRQEAVSKNAEPRAGSLVLTRNVDQTIIIGSNTGNPIEVTILETTRDRRVKVGIFDPLKRLVLREELISTPPNPTTTAA